MQTLVATKKTATFTRSGPASSRHRRIIAVGPPDMDGDVWELTLKVQSHCWICWILGWETNEPCRPIRLRLIYFGHLLTSLLNASFIFEQCCHAARPVNIFHTEVLEQHLGHCRSLGLETAKVLSFSWVFQASPGIVTLWESISQIPVIQFSPNSVVYTPLSL